jgi:pseudoazurin
MRNLLKVVATSAVLMVLVPAAPASAKQWEVKMLNKGATGAMVFEPAFIKIAPGDTVKFVASDKSHNAESIPGLIPAGAAPFKGKMNEDVVVPFSTPGLYAYKCMPHMGMGMVGLVEVKSAGNKDAVAVGTGKLPALAKAKFEKLLLQAK